MNTDSELNELLARLAGQFEAEMDVEQGVMRLRGEVRRLSATDPSWAWPTQDVAAIRQKFIAPTGTDGVSDPLDAGGRIASEPGLSARRGSVNAVDTVPERNAAAGMKPNAQAEYVVLLVRRAADMERRAWEELVSRYSPLIWAMARDFNLEESDAADVVQATWLRLLENIDHLPHPARVGSWLAVTARRECTRQLASRRRIVFLQDCNELTDAISAEPQVEEYLIEQERASAVREALRRLPQRWQELMAALMADPSRSYAEISELIGLSVNSIGPTRSRCLARLRVLLQDVSEHE